MPRVFLSYRRDDAAGFAGRLADDLEAAFGQGGVFRDVDDIRPGEDFAHAIQSQLRGVDAVLVMIGPRWLTAAAGGGRRLEDADDFVRREIQAALASGKPVIPVLVGGATMPAQAELPAAIAGLARHQAVALRDDGWRDDVARLVSSLSSVLPSLQTEGVAFAPNWRRWVLGLAGGGLALTLMVWMIQVWRLPPPAATVSSQPAADISGRWTARVKYDWGDEHEEVFEFKYLGRDLRGTATYLTGRLAIEQAKREGEWLGFVTRSQEMLGSDTPWKEVTHRYTGQVTSEGIRFTLESGGGYSVHPPVEFTATRVSRP